MAILITGGAGYVGSHTAKLLSESGAEVVVLDDLRTGFRRNMRWGSSVEGDVSDTTLVRRVLAEHRVTAVLHLAASAHVGESMRKPELYFSNNVRASISLLESMLAERVHKIVFASSSSVYGDFGSMALDEEDVPVPVSPYGESKLQTEKMLRWYGRAFGFQWTALRYFNVAGAEGGLGEELATSTRIIPRAVNAVCGTQRVLQIFGQNFGTPDGTAVRDYVHIADVAEANLRALQHLETGESGEVINIGSGVATSVRQILEAVGRFTKAGVPESIEQPRKGDPAVAVANISRGRRVLDWTPRRSDLHTIVSSVLDQVGKSTSL